MNSAVKNRISPIAREYGWRSRFGTPSYIQKDGYELYFYRDGEGFEVTIRDPESMDDRVPVIKVRDMPTGAPLYVALIQEILSDVELIVNQCSNEL